MNYEQWLAHKREFDESKVKRDSNGRFAEKASSSVTAESLEEFKRRGKRLYPAGGGKYTTDQNKSIHLSDHLHPGGLPDRTVYGPADVRTPARKLSDAISRIGRETLRSANKYVEDGKRLLDKIDKKFFTRELTYTDIHDDPRWKPVKVPAGPPNKRGEKSKWTIL